MSIEIVSAVFMRGPKQPARKLVLVAIADNANDYGIAWPGISLVAHKSSVSVRTAMRILDFLVSEEWISVEKRAVQKQDRKTKRKRPGAYNRYQINLKKLGLSGDNLSPDNSSRDRLTSESPVQKRRPSGGNPVKRSRKTRS